LIYVFPKTGTPYGSFPLAASPPLALARGFQRTGGSSQSRITKSKICGQTLINKIRVKLLGKGYGIKSGAIINTLKTYGELEE
jgi:hypothetical protein